MSMHNGSMLDTMNTKGFAKYANDATYNVNHIFINNAVIVQNDAGKICLAASCDINAREEIYCSYGAKYWKNYM